MVRLTRTNLGVRPFFGVYQSLNLRLWDAFVILKKSVKSYSIGHDIVLLLLADPLNVQFQFNVA